MNSKILIVDDDEGIVDALSLILEDSGYTVDTTTKGAETYAKVSSFQPDIILLDVLMSGNDGRHICKKLKSDEATKQIPIIMISAHPSAKESVLTCGAEAFIPKPFDIDTLLQVVAQYES